MYLHSFFTANNILFSTQWSECTQEMTTNTVSWFLNHIIPPVQVTLQNYTVPQPDNHSLSTQHSNNLKSHIIVIVICTKKENVVTVNTTYCNQKEVVTSSKQACTKKQNTSKHISSESTL